MICMMYEDEVMEENKERERLRGKGWREGATCPAVSLSSRSGAGWLSP